MAQIQILGGMDVFDAAIMAYGDISMAVKMLQDNPSIFPDWNTTIPGVAVFDESMVVAIVPGVQLVEDVQDDGNRTMTGIANQSIFDVALMTLGTIDRNAMGITADYEVDVDSAIALQKAVHRLYAVPGIVLVTMPVSTIKLLTSGLTSGKGLIILNKTRWSIYIHLKD